MKTTAYFDFRRNFPDRAPIKDAWIQQVVDHPERIEVQSDGRIRKWAKIAEFDGRHLRVVLLEDGITVHNAFFDRDYGA